VDFHRHGDRLGGPLQSQSAEDQSQVEEGDSKDAEQDGDVVGAPDGDDDGGLGIAWGVDCGDGVAGSEFGVVAALRGEDLDEIAVCVAKAKAGVVVDSTARHEVGDVFYNGRCDAYAGVGESPFWDAAGRGQEQEDGADPGEELAGDRLKFVVGVLEPSEKFHTSTLREGGRGEGPSNVC